MQGSTASTFGRDRGVGSGGVLVGSWHAAAETCRRGRRVMKTISGSAGSDAALPDPGQM